MMESKSATSPWPIDQGTKKGGKTLPFLPLQSEARARSIFIRF